ncbi:MAG: sensor histidine kinase, partial [Isosphaeraceae bacterium]
SRRRYRYRHKLDEAVTKILAGLGTEVVTIRGAVELAARELRKTLGYRRVMVSLVTPDRKRLRGYFEASDDSAQALLAVADFSLDPPETSFHVEAALKGKPIRARHIPSHPLADQGAALAAEITAGAFIPLDTGRRDPKSGLPIVLGSLAVEREDLLPPDRAEFNDLIQFGRKLAGIVEQSERVQLLQESLNLQREPLAILDAGGRLRYANRPASAFLGDDYHPGWRHPEASPQLEWKADPRSIGPSPLSQAVQQARLAFHHRHRFAVTARDHAPGGGQAWAVLADAIGAEGAPPLGVFVEAQDLSFLHRVFNAFGQLLRPENLYPETGPEGSTPRGALQERLVEEIGRAFASHLAMRPVSYDAYDPEAGRFQRLWRHEYPSDALVRLDGGPTYAADEQTVQCFHPPAPTVFQYDRECRSARLETVFTRKGLVANAVQEPIGAPEDLEREGLWVEFPLFAGSRPLGKLVFACDDSFLPENLELLKTYLTLFHGIVGALFELTERHERNALERIREKDAAGIEAVKEFVHHLRQPLGSISLLLHDLRGESVGHTNLLRLIDEIEDTVSRYDRYLDLIRTVGSFEIRPSPLDLPRLIRETLEMAARSERYEIQVPPSDGGTNHALECEVDEFYFKLALSELVENSRKYGPHDRWKITVTIDLDAGLEGPSWIVLKFLDNGPGIPRSHKSRIFERGERVPRDDRKPGTGLGLHCVARIVQEHRGTIEENGEEGRGVQFIVRLPMRRPEGSA